MPSVRAKNKVFFGCFIDRRFSALLKSVAKKEGMAHNVTGFAMKLMRESLKRRGVKVPESKSVSEIQARQERRFNLGLKKSSKR